MDDWFAVTGRAMPAQDLPALDLAPLTPAEVRRLCGMNVLDGGDRQAPSSIAADWHAAMKKIYADDAPRPTIEVTAEEWDALTHVEPKDWPRLYGLPSDFGGVQVVVVGIDTVRRRQAEMDELLGD